MKKGILFFSAIFFLLSCKKPVVNKNPGILYTDLGGKEIKFHDILFLDLNKDGQSDIFFSTLYVGDPIAKQDKEKYLVRSSVNSFLPINSNEFAPILNKGENVPIENFSDFSWYEVAQVELAQKVTGVTGPPFWEGEWKDAKHKYLPIQIKVNNQRFNGWIELSFDSEGEKIILHKAAISSEAEKEIRTG